MLDCYVHGEVDRISPEAPVPVVRARRERAVPGGAANVARNLSSLGVSAYLVGVTGQDEARAALIAGLAGREDRLLGELVPQGDRPTTRKLRIIGGGQQVVRIDFEETARLEAATEERLTAAAIRLLPDCDLIVLSDYGKGVLSDRVLSQVIRAATAAGRRVLLDPKRTDWRAYAGADLITPNRKELAVATGLPCDTDAEIVAAAREAAELTGADVLVTRSEKGMTFVPKDGAPIHMGTVAKNVFDVSGAGDTVLAVLAATLAAGHLIEEAMRMANHAAGLVIGKVGTATVSLAEIEASLAADTAQVDDGALVTLEEAVALRARWRGDGFSVGFTNGCFDLVHPGHVSLIRQAAMACDRLFVGLNSDASTRRLKGRSRPIQDEASRAAVVGAIRGVAGVLIFDEDTPMRVIDALRPDVLVKGADYTEENVVGADIVRSEGGRILLANLTPGQSTTRLARRSMADTDALERDRLR